MHSYIHSMFRLDPIQDGQHIKYSKPNILKQLKFKLILEITKLYFVAEAPCKGELKSMLCAYPSNTKSQRKLIYI